MATAIPLWRVETRSSLWREPCPGFGQSSALSSARAGAGKLHHPSLRAPGLSKGSTLQGSFKISDYRKAKLTHSQGRRCGWWWQCRYLGETLTFSLSQSVKIMARARQECVSSREYWKSDGRLKMASVVVWPSKHKDLVARVQQKFVYCLYIVSQNMGLGSWKLRLGSLGVTFLRIIHH